LLKQQFGFCSVGVLCRHIAPKTANVYQCRRLDYGSYIILHASDSFNCILSELTQLESLADVSITLRLINLVIQNQSSFVCIFFLAMHVQREKPVPLKCLQHHVN